MLDGRFEEFLPGTTCASTVITTRDLSKCLHHRRNRCRCRVVC
jgi:hypothetical protein